MIKKVRGVIWFGIMAFLSMLFIPFLASETLAVDEGPKIVECRVSAENPCVTWYLTGLSGKIDNAEAYTGSDEVAIDEFGTVGEAGAPATHTLILVDNSDRMKGNSGAVATILTRIIWNHEPNEKFIVVTMDPNAEALTEMTGNYDEVRSAVSSLAYGKHTTSLRNVLYSQLEALAAYEDECFDRAIVISDGTDESVMGVTYDELLDLVGSKEYGCPVVTIGFYNKASVNGLERLFALSRKSKAPYFSVADYENVEDIADSINDEYSDIRYFRFGMQDEYRDGCERSIGLHLEQGETEYMLSNSMVIPLASYEEIKNLSQIRKDAAEEERLKKEELENRLNSLDAITAELGDKSVSGNFLFPSLASEEDDEETTPLTFRQAVFRIITENGTWIAIIFLIMLVSYIVTTGRNRRMNGKFEEEKVEDTNIMHMDGYITEGIRLVNIDQTDIQYTLNVGGEKVIGRSRARCDIAFPLDRAMASRQALIRIGKDMETGSISAYLENLDTQGGTSVDNEVVIDGITLANGAVLKLGSTRLRVIYV